jgi:Protein of unknown function (DUF3352)
LHGRAGKTGGALALAASIALAIAACGDGDGAELASLAPPDAPFYAEVALRPGDEQAETIEAYAERVAGFEDPAAAIIAELDASLADGDIDATYSEDIEPWLGERGALFVRSFERSSAFAMTPDVALMAEVDDPGAAQEFIDLVAAGNTEGSMDEHSYGGVDYRLDDVGTAIGLIDDILTVGPEDAFKVAVDAADGESLAESEEFTQRTEALGDGDDLLATAYLEPGAAIEAAFASEDVNQSDARLLKPLLDGPLSDPLAIGLSATPAAARLDLVSKLEGEEDIATDASLIERLPGGSWFAVGAPDLGAALERALDQLANGGLPGARSIRETIRDATGFDLRADSFDWLGDAAAFVEGTSAPGFTAGLITETTDPRGPRKLLERAQDSAERESGLRSAAPPDGADHGFSLGLPGLGGGAEAGLIGGRLVAVAGGTVAEALEPHTRLGDDPGYEATVESLGEEFPPGLYVRLESFFEVAEQGGSASDPAYQAAIPYLEAFESLAAGTRVEDGLALTRLTVSLVD